MEATHNAPPQTLTARQWLILGTAGFGFAFDAYELIIMSIVLRPVLMDLGGLAPGTAEFNHWAGLLLFAPMVIGGLAALYGGWLTDRFGRQRVLVWSIVGYGLAAFFSSLSTSLVELMFWRCITVAGACVEFVAAIAWLSELFPDGRRRESVLGFSQICAALGNLLIAGAYYAAVTWGDSMPAIQGGHSAWRYALLFGALPAIPLMIVRPFLPESPHWAARRAAGTLRRPSYRELFTPRLRRITVITTLLLASGYALAFGMMQHIPRVVPGLPGVAELARQQQEQWVSWVHLHVDIGAILGRVLLAALVTWLVVRGPILKWLLIAAAVSIPFIFLGPPVDDADLFRFSVILVALIVGAQYSFWGNYLPRMFPLHLRGTGESFAISIGGRVLAPMAAIATTQLSTLMPGANPSLRLASAVAVVGLFAVVCGLLLVRRLPEPPAELPEE